MILKTNILKWGNDKGIKLPKTILKILKWENNTKVEIIIENDFIKIRKIRNQKKNIKELFENYNEGYKCSEIDWDKSDR